MLRLELCVYAGQQGKKIKTAPVAKCACGIVRVRSAAARRRCGVCESWYMATISICFYMCVCKICIHGCTYIWICVLMCVSIHVCQYISCIHFAVCSCSMTLQVVWHMSNNNYLKNLLFMCVFANINIYAYMDTCIYTYVSVYVNKYICMYLYTHAELQVEVWTNCHFVFFE